MNRMRWIFSYLSSLFSGFLFRFNFEEKVDWSKRYIICANHTSNLDITAMILLVKRNYVFFGKEELLDNFITGIYFRTIDITVKRESKISAFRAFKKAEEKLKSGKTVVIFPEGKSHDLPQLAPLRTGLARMTLQAYQAHGVRGVRIVPIGLLFERKEAPRSRVLMQVGEPIHLDPLVDAGASVATLTQIVAARLAAITLNFDSPEDAERLQRVGGTLSALLEPTPSVAEGAPALGRVLSLLRRLDRVHGTLRARDDAALHARLDGFEARVRAFHAELRQFYYPRLFRNERFDPAQFEAMPRFTAGAATD